MSKSKLEMLEAVAQRHAKANAILEGENALRRRARAEWRARIIANEEAILATQPAFSEEVARVEPLFHELLASDDWRRLAAVTDLLFRRAPCVDGPYIVSIRGAFAARGFNTRAEVIGTGWPLWKLGETLELCSVHHAKFYGRRELSIASFPSFASLARVPDVRPWNEMALSENASDLDRVTELLCARWLVQQVAEGTLLDFATARASNDNRPLRTVGF